MERIRGQVWVKGKPVDGFHLDMISECIDDPERLVWADLESPTHETFEQLADELHLSRFAVEDTVALAERVKTVTYATYTFMTVYAITVDAADDDDDAPGDTDTSPGVAEVSGDIPTARHGLVGHRAKSFELHRISIFIKKNALITVRNHPGFDMNEVVSRWADEKGERYGVGALLHGLLDVVVDGHFDAVQMLDDEIENLETLLFDERPGNARALQRQTYDLRKDLVLLRRVVLPMREVIAGIQRRRFENQAPPELDPHFSDLYDHALRAAEWTESLRDMVSTVFETNLSLADARLNTVMKKLTSWAAIIAVPTAITGFYGQNVPYPGFSQTVGFITSSTLIIVLMAVLYVAFRKRDWL